MTACIASAPGAPIVIRLFDAGLHADGIVNILFKYRTDGFVLFEFHIIKGDSFVNAVQNETADNAMCIAERNACFQPGNQLRPLHW